MGHLAVALVMAHLWVVKGIERKLGKGVEVSMKRGNSDLAPSCLCSLGGCGGGGRGSWQLELEWKMGVDGRLLLPLGRGWDIW